MNRILLIANDFPPESGGIQVIISETFRQIKNRNIIILAPVCSHSKEYDLKYPQKVIRCKFLKLGLFSPSKKINIFKKSFLYTIFGIIPLIRVIRRYNCKILVCGHIAVCPLAFIVKKIFGFPYITFTYAMEILHLPKEHFRRKIIKILLCQSTKILTISEFTFGELCEIGVKKENIIKIPLGHPHLTDRKSNSEGFLKIGEGKFKMLTVGRLVERKGHDKILEGLSILVKKGYKMKYIVVGDGPMKQKLVNLSKKFGVREQVEFVGNIPYSQTPSYYKMCDLFIMPSRYIRERKDVEGFGVVFLEANFFGKPVIGGNSGGIPDAIKDGVTGLLVNPEDPKDIAGKIEKLINNPKLAKRLGEQGRKRVLEEFTWERAAGIIERTMSVCKAGK